MVNRVRDHASGIVTIDTGYQRARLVACYLIQQGDEYAFVDTGTSSCIQSVRKVLAEKDIKPFQIKYIMVTHVHLDHAGAAGVMMQDYPEAQLIVHPRGVRHMVDPARLIAGAAAVYGEVVLKKTFGDILPVDSGRIIEATDEMVLDLNGRQLLFLDTPGHAKHHYCVYDEQGNNFFTGDTFGLSYPEFDVDGRQFIFPTTSPVQFDPVALHESINRLMSYKPDNMYLAHFGRVQNPHILAEMLHSQIDYFVELAERLDGSENRHEQIRQGLADLLVQGLKEYECKLEGEQIIRLMAMDLELNTQGLESWLDYKKKGQD